MRTKGLKLKFRKTPTVTAKDYLNWWKVWRTLPVANWVRAAALFRKKDFRQAAALYQKGIKSNPDHPAVECARLDYAYALLQVEKHQEAEDVLKDLCERQVSLPDAYFILARHYVKGEMYVEALQLLKKVTEKYPAQARLLGLYALTAWMYGFTLLDEKEIEYRLIVARNKLTPRDQAWAIVTTALAVRCHKLSRHRESEEYLSQVVAMGAAPVEAFLLRYRQLGNLSKPDRAVDQLQRAIRLSPRDPRPLYEYARHLSSARDYDTLNHARQLAERASQLSFYRSPAALLLYSELEGKIGSMEKAEILETHSFLLKSERDLNFIDLDTFQIQLSRLREG